MVAVEAQQRQQLPDHLQDLGGHDQQDRVPAGQPPDREHREDDEGVEVQPAEVGPDPPGPAEAVAVGDVGVEGRPEEVEAEPHGTGGRSAVARRRGVAELVEAGRQHGEDDDGEEQRRVAERLGRRRREPLGEQHPAGDRAERQHDRHDDQRREQDGERRRQPAGDARVGHDAAELQREQRVGPAELRLGPVGPEQQSERAQRRVHQLRHVLHPHQPPGRGTDLGGHLGQRPPPVHRPQHLLQQRRERDDLAVAATDQGRRMAVAGAGDLAEQLHPARPREDLLLHSRRPGP